MSDQIVAIVTYRKDNVLHSGPPVFYCETREKAERTALLLSKTTLAMVHDIENDCFVIVQH